MGLSVRGLEVKKWARSLRDQCADAGVPFFFKQWGGRGQSAPALLDGKEHQEFPKVGE
ncbi:MAG: phage Gp37/Gp68 family protein [Verrucomicrobiales bacterium]|nr:phage Gp37/Gp68 family protein [Verrucomicrobiales bacterium]